MIPGHNLVLEEGLQSAWLYETLSPHVDEIVVAGIWASRELKSHKRGAYGLAEKLRVGNLDKHVFKAPRQFTRLRELSRIHITLVTDVVVTGSNPVGSASVRWATSSSVVAGRPLRVTQRPMASSPHYS